MIGMTRLAASDPALWTQILLSNAENTAGTIETIARDLRGVAEALRNRDQASVSEFLAAGREGRRLLRRPEDDVS
jgi:prephenate dehydrogenase